MLEILTKYDKFKLDTEFEQEGSNYGFEISMGVAETLDDLALTVKFYDFLKEDKDDLAKMQNFENQREAMKKAQIDAFYYALSQPFEMLFKDQPFADQLSDNG